MRVVTIVILSTAVMSVAPRSKAGRALFVLSAIAAAMVVVLIDGPVARAIAMVIGFPSIASVALLADIALRRAYDRPLLLADERRHLLWFMAVASLALYPSALGYVYADVYHVGFDWFAPPTVAAIGVLLAIRREYRLALLALVVLVSLDIELLPSNNVFDYVVDPVGGLCAMGWVVAQSARTLMRSLSGAFDAKRQSGAAGGRAAAYRPAE